MKLRRAAALTTACAVFMLVTAPVAAQVAPSVPGAPGSPMPKAPDPCPIPYSVGEQISGFELAARFGLSAIKHLSKVPNIEARGGKEVIRTAYAGVTHQAMTAVLDAYACRIESHIRANGLTDAAAKIAAVQEAISDLTLEMSLVQNAGTDGAETLSEIAQRYRSAHTREEGAPVLDVAVTRAALAEVDPQALFISVVQRKKWGALSFVGIAEVRGCGGVVKAAISDGGSSLQRSLADAKSILINFLDPTKKPKVALSTLFGALSASPISNATVNQTTTFKDCTKDVAEAQAAATEPATPAAVTPTGTVDSALGAAAPLADQVPDSTASGTAPTAVAPTAPVTQAPAPTTDAPPAAGSTEPPGLTTTSPPAAPAPATSPPAAPAAPNTTTPQASGASATSPTGTPDTAKTVDQPASGTDSTAPPAPGSRSNR